MRRFERNIGLCNGSRGSAGTIELEVSFEGRCFDVDEHCGARQVRKSGGAVVIVCG